GTIGILASGALLEGFYWGSIFVVSAVISAITLVMLILLVPSTKAEEPVRFDPVGSVISAVGIGLLVLGIIEGPDRGWTDPVTLIGLAGGLLFLVVFVLVELRASAPLLDPRLFKHRGFATGSASLFLQFLAMFAFFFVALQFLQLVMGYGTLAAAGALVPMSVVLVVVSAVSGTMSERYGHRLVGGAGLAVSALGFLIFALLGTSSGFWPFLLATLVIGAGAALAMSPATNAIIASLPLDKQGVASAVNDTSRELGAAFGVAILGSAFNIGYRRNIDSHLSGYGPAVVKQAREAPAIAIQLAHRLPNGSVLLEDARNAFVFGMRVSIGLGVVLLLAGASFVWVRGASRVEQIREDELDEDFDLEIDLVPDAALDAVPRA
ncbi:MAG: multidrug transporter, partial [Actinomycetia bacterium]|nr:multidrug transporter [Actinomycetes bacterium]